MGQVSVASRSHAFSREKKAWYIYTAYSANQSDFRKRVTSPNTPTHIFLLVYNLSKIFSWQLSPHNSLYCTPVCVYSRQRIHTYSFMGSRIRDSAAAVRQRLLWDSCSRKSKKRSLLQGQDVFVALPTGFAKSLCYCFLPYVFYKLRGFTNGSIAVVVNPLN